MHNPQILSAHNYCLFHHPGHYLYFETSSPLLPGDTAILKSPTMVTKSGERLLFFYHMFGHGMGTLKALLATDTSPPKILRSITFSGGETDKWHQGDLDLADCVKCYIAFVGIRGATYTSDIALDDVSIKRGVSINGCSKYFLVSYSV